MFGILSFMMSSNAWVQNKKYISLNSLGCKHNWVMKFGQIKRKNLIKKFYKKCGLKASSKFSCVYKQLSTTLLENEIFETN